MFQILFFIVLEDWCDTFHSLVNRYLSWSPSFWKIALAKHLHQHQMYPMRSHGLLYNQFICSTDPQLICSYHRQYLCLPDSSATSYRGLESWRAYFISKNFGKQIFECCNPFHILISRSPRLPVNILTEVSIFAIRIPCQFRVQQSFNSMTNQYF